MTLHGTYTSTSLPASDLHAYSNKAANPTEEEGSTTTPSLSNSSDQTNSNNSDSGSSTTDSAKQRAEESINQAKILELQAIDTSVRAHEAAHLAAGGGVATGGASFSYVRGPDGKMYATGGEVPIDASEGNTPDETIRKAQQIRAAALAPSDPSPQDYKVAAQASLMEQSARIEKVKELQDQAEGRKSYQNAAQELEPSVAVAG